MELTPALVGPPWQAFGLAAFAAALWWTGRGAPWRWLVESGAFARLAGAAAALLVVWLLRARPEGGPAFHLLGATLMTLAFGWRLAVLALAAVLAIAAGVTGNVAAAGVNGFGCILVPVGVSYGWARATERWLPPNPFVYVFSSAFFGAAVAVACAVAVSAALIACSGAAPAGELGANYVPTSLLLLFPEAFLTGALVTLAVVYRPSWLVSWSDGAWLPGR